MVNKINKMALEQITTDYEDDDDQQPKNGMVETETGRMVTKVKSAKDQKSFINAMQDQYKNRLEVMAAAKLKAAKLKAMKKK